MKKFNSILAIATVALTSVFGFTSCDKADEPFDSCPNPQPIPGTTVQTPTPESTDDIVEIHERTIMNQSDIDFIGTWEYTDGNGTNYSIEVTELESSDYMNIYKATLSVNGQQYPGDFTPLAFGSHENSKEHGYAYIIEFSNPDYYNLQTKDSFVADIITYDYKTIETGVTFNRIK